MFTYIQKSKFEFLKFSHFAGFVLLLSFKTIAQDEVKGKFIMNKIDQVVNETMRLKQNLLMTDSISRFNIHGASGLKRAFKAMLGEASDLYLSEAAKGKEAEAEFGNSRAWQAIMRHIKTFDRVAGRILKYQPLLEKGLQILLGAPDRLSI